MRTSLKEHGSQIGKPLPVAGSIWSLDLAHFLISVVLHASLTHAAFAHGGWRGKAESAIGSDRTCKVRTYLLVVARIAHREPLAGGGVLLELGRAPVLDLRALAPDADARRVRARGLEMKSRVSDRVGQDVQSKTSPPSWSTWCKSARPPSPACRCGRSGSPWRRASPIRPRRRTRGRRSRRQPARRREVRWDTVERNTSMGPAGTHLVSHVARLADLLVGVLAGAPPARLASLAHGAQDGAVAHGAPVALGARDDVVLLAVDDVRQDHERAGASPLFLFSFLFSFTFLLSVASIFFFVAAFSGAVFVLSVSILFFSDAAFSARSSCSASPSPSSPTPPSFSSSLRASPPRARSSTGPSPSSTAAPP